MDKQKLLQKISEGNLPTNNPAALNLDARNTLSTLYDEGYCVPMQGGWVLTGPGYLLLSELRADPRAEVVSSVTASLMRKVSEAKRTLWTVDEVNQLIYDVQIDQHKELLQ